MRGHHALIAMRRRRRRPAYVWVDTDRDHSKAWADWQHATPTAAQLQVDPQDVPALLDLRCLVGLTVIVAGSDEALVGAIAAAVAAHEPGRLIVATFTTTRGEPELLACTDTLQERADG